MAVKTGTDGDDIFSTRYPSVDQISGGLGFDQWFGGYYDASVPLTFTYDGQNGRLSDGTTINGIERIGFDAGSGDDNFTVTGGRLSIDGNGGFNTLTLDLGKATMAASTGGGFYFGDDGRVTGGAVTPDGVGVTISGFNMVDATLTAMDDQFTSSPGMIGQVNGTIRIDGGAGSDTFNVRDLLSNELYGLGQFEVFQVGLAEYIVRDLRAGATGQITIRNFEHVRFAGGSIDLAIFAPTHQFVGTGSADKLIGTDEADLLLGYGGNDRLTGGDGDDRLIGDDGIDTLDAGDGADQLAGGAGNDKLLGGIGNDLLLGGDGNDMLDGGVGVDRMTGDYGNDTYVVDNSQDQVFETDRDGGMDSVRAAVDFTLGDNVENLTLTGAAVLTGTGNALDNRLTANDAGNILFGGAGNDTLKGGAGDDRLNGGAGRDVLAGGFGGDTFVFDNREFSNRVDAVKDFASGQDRIEIAVSAFTALSAYGLGALDTGELAFGRAAVTADQHLIYNSANGSLYYDADGVGGASQVQIAAFTSHPGLSAADFFLI